ncbi:hypothetical protein ALO64_200134 [Pseudomonas meliae]|uniref:Uncharacterized protein n=1 Tax=Pseudomonas meliae TaxID=86176 RepID=A0A0P9VDZ3_9PSED|nr:hypothetical protein ALO64_200134 [Pseudomonas meliae]
MQLFCSASAVQMQDLPKAQAGQQCNSMQFSATQCSGCLLRFDVQMM